MKILFIYLNSDESDSLHSKKRLIEHTFFFKYLKDHTISKFEFYNSIEHSQFKYVNEIICAFDFKENPEIYESIIKSFDLILIISNGVDTDISNFLKPYSDTSNIVSISFNEDHLVEVENMYGPTKSPTFITSYSFLFNQKINVQKNKEMTELDSEITNSLIYKMDHFSPHYFLLCLLNQTMPVCDVKYFDKNLFYQFPIICQIVSTNLVYTEYNDEYQNYLVNKYQLIMKEIYKSNDWNLMQTESTYINEVKKVLKIS